MCKNKTIRLHVEYFVCSLLCNYMLTLDIVLCVSKCSCVCVCIRVQHPFMSRLKIYFNEIKQRKKEPARNYTDDREYTKALYFMFMLELGMDFFFLSLTDLLNIYSVSYFTDTNYRIKCCFLIDFYVRQGRAGEI